MGLTAHAAQVPLVQSQEFYDLRVPSGGLVTGNKIFLIMGSPHSNPFRNEESRIMNLLDTVAHNKTDFQDYTY